MNVCSFQDTVAFIKLRTWLASSVLFKNKKSALRKCQSNFYDDFSNLMIAFDYVYFLAISRASAECNFSQVQSRNI